MESVCAESAAAPKSRFQLQAEKMRNQIKQLEEESVAAKPWFLRGEISSSSRPVDSLLDLDVDYEAATKVSTPFILH
jgi:U3 small nucleolar RNA-associated protein MPP10